MATNDIIQPNTTELLQYPTRRLNHRESDLEARNARLERYVARLLAERVEGCPNCGHVRIERSH